MAGDGCDFPEACMPRCLDKFVPVLRTLGLLDNHIGEATTEQRICCYWDFDEKPLHLAQVLLAQNRLGRLKMEIPVPCMNLPCRRIHHAEVGNFVQGVRHRRHLNPVSGRPERP